MADKVTTFFEKDSIPWHGMACHNAFTGFIRFFMNAETKCDIPNNSFHRILFSCQGSCFLCSEYIKELTYFIQAAIF
jgi:hypothetical protein